MDNKIIKNFIMKCESNCDELAKFSKILEGQDEKKEEKDEENIYPQKDSEKNQGLKVHSNQGHNEIKIKLSELEIGLITLKKHLDHNIRGSVVEEDEEEKVKEGASGNLRDYIKNVYISVKNMTERVIVQVIKIDKVSFKQESLNSEILGRVKKDLTSKIPFLN